MKTNALLAQEKGISMTTVTTTEFRRDSASVYNQVQVLGWVRIKHRDRPDMLLITQTELDELLKQAEEKGKEKAA